MVKKTFDKIIDTAKKLFSKKDISQLQLMRSLINQELLQVLFIFTLMISLRYIHISYQNIANSLEKH